MLSNAVREALAVRVAATINADPRAEEVEADLCATVVDEAQLKVEVMRLRAGAECREIINEINAEDSSDSEDVRSMFSAIAAGIGGNRPRRKF